MTGQKYVAGKGNPSPIERSVDADTANQANQSATTADEQQCSVSSGTLELFLLSRFGRDSEAMIVYRALSGYKREQLGHVLNGSYTDEDERNTTLDEVEIAEQIMLDIVAILQRSSSDNRNAYESTKAQPTDIP
jgi:hypothetical protein